MPTRKYDYADLERQYVRGDMSIRELARDNNVRTWSTIHDYARRNAWAEKREKFREQLQAAENRVVVQKHVSEVAKALDDAVRVANSAVFNFLDSLKDRWVTDSETGKRVFLPGQVVGAADFVKIMEKLMLLNGQATSREERNSVSLSAEATQEMTMEMLRDLATAARQSGADVRPAADSPLPRIEGARSVN